MTAQYFLFVTLVTGGPPVRINPQPGAITEANEAEKKEEFKADFLRRLDQASAQTRQSIKRVVLCKEKDNRIEYICQVYPKLD